MFLEATGAELYSRALRQHFFFSNLLFHCLHILLQIIETCYCSDNYKAEHTDNVWGFMICLSCILWSTVNIYQHHVSKFIFMSKSKYIKIITFYWMGTFENASLCLHSHAVGLSFHHIFSNNICFILHDG